MPYESAFTNLETPEVSYPRFFGFVEVGVWILRGNTLVFLTDSAAQNSEPEATATYSTTALTKTYNTATVDGSVIATSNGHSGKDRFMGSTSKGSSGAGRAAGVVPSLTAVFAVLASVGVLYKAFSS